MVAALLIPISAAGAAEADIDFDALRRLLLDGLIPVVSVAGQNMARSLDCGLSIRQAAVELGVSVDTVVSLHRAGDLKALPLPGATRLRRADVESYARKLTAVPMTDELREAIWPSVEEYRGAGAEPGILDGWSEGMRHTEARDAAALARDDADFAQYLREQHFPEPKLTDVGEGVQEFDPNGSLSPEQVADQRRAWHKQRQAAAEARKYALLHSHNPRGY